MAELENKIEEENLEQDWDLNEEVTTDEWSDEITYEQAMEWKKKAESLEKAEAKIVELKKTAKKTPEPKEEKKEIDSNNDLELRLYFIENPELKEDKEWIMEVLSQEKYKNLTPLEAREIYNLNKPKQSESKKLDFWGGQYIPKPKSLKDMSDEDAMKLDPVDYIKRLKQRWELK